MAMVSFVLSMYYDLIPDVICDCPYIDMAYPRDEFGNAFMVVRASIYIQIYQNARKNTM